MATHDIYIEENCDLWSMMDGYLFFRTKESKKCFAHITGIRYSEEGDKFEGDFEGFINLLDDALKIEFNLAA